ncbi:S1C family serine protease [Actinomycetospora corticicola]|uniref:S1-C subfamily serine protease n=1 Tax=Actinomycetospora corticicola TaxID=663602 RepID=A0A7Y9J5I1_9PSEU|nr:S1-C subfamily serine protease [Actinomycetospora corticicola]
MLAATACSSAATPAAAPAESDVVQTVAAQVDPSAVTILTDGGNGSGVVFDADGLIVTNEHVVRGRTDVEVAFVDGQRVAGTVRATDPVTDIALVQAQRRGLPAARFEPAPPVVGSLAIVIGSPLGFENSVTAGVISGLHREVPGSAAYGQSLVDLIQTDAAISPGNSGGALVNPAGAVTGISLAYIPPQSGAVSIGFAIPAATVLDVVDQLQRTGRATHAFAGLAPAAITQQMVDRLGLPDTNGVITAGVVPGGPAARAGIRAGDIIRSVNGTPVTTPESFQAALRTRQPGESATLGIRGIDGQERNVTITLTDRPAVSG